MQSFVFNLSDALDADACAPVQCNSIFTFWSMLEMGIAYPTSSVQFSSVQFSCSVVLLARSQSSPPFAPFADRRQRGGRPEVIKG